MNEIINECKGLIKEGYKRITLLGQNVNSYGNDVEDEKINFANLLNAVANLEGNFRLQFMTSHPKDLTDEVIKTIATNNKISKAIHLPVQSGSNSVLKDMNRKYTVEHYLNLIKKIKKNIKNVFISSDFIVGFPGETNEDFENTLNLIKEVNYDNLFAYMYSKRSGTLASEMENQIDIKIKKERVNKLLNMQRELVNLKRKTYIGKTYLCLAERVEEKFSYALNDAGHLIEINSTNLEVGQFVNLKITSSSTKKTTAEVA